MKVLVDNRELTLLRLLKKLCQPEFVKLPVADLAIVNNTGALILERKTVPDFIRSMRSNRLWAQLLAMMKVTDLGGCEIKRRILVIQGSFWEYINRLSSNEERYWSNIVGALLAVNFEYGIPCIVCENNFAFEVFLRILIQRELNGKNSALPYARWYRKPTSRLPVKEAKRYVLDAIPSIGESRAKLLLDSYGSIRNLALRSKEDLMKIQGIGQKRAEIIHEIFN